MDEKYERYLRGRFLRRAYIQGWQATSRGLMVMYADGQREVLEMSQQDALENAWFLASEFGKEVVCISYE